MDCTRLKTLLGAALLLAASAAQAAEARLDRPGLLRLADNYFAALAAHDTSRVPLAPEAKTVEDLKRIKAGEGLWKTTTAVPTGFRIIAADPESQSVGGIVILGKAGKPVQLGFRLKLANGRIIEAEHLVVDINDPARPTLQQARAPFAMEIPYEYADSRGRLLHMAKSYYDALDNNNGHLAPFAPDCERYENGMRTAPNGGPSLAPFVPPSASAATPAPRPPSLMGMQDCTFQLDSGTFQYIDRIDNRRVEIADTVTGIAVGFSHFRHSMQQKKFRLYGIPGREESDMSGQNPFDMPAIHVFKIWGGQIHEIEAVGIVVPLNSASGWE